MLMSSYFYYWLSLKAEDDYSLSSSMALFIIYYSWRHPLLIYCLNFYNSFLSCIIFFLRLYKLTNEWLLMLWVLAFNWPLCEEFPFKWANIYFSCYSHIFNYYLSDILYWVAFFILFYLVYLACSFISLAKLSFC